MSARTAFAGAAVLLTLLSLWPVCALPVLPMQDYPQHLLQGWLLAMPDAEISRNFEANWVPGPYALFFGAAAALSRVLPIEVVGRVLVALTLALTPLVVWRAAVRAPGQAPWAALLLFPIAFSPQYFQGNVTYLASVPVLCLALMDDADRRAAGLAPRLAWPVLLWLLHPLTLLVHALLVAGAALAAPHGARRRCLAPAVLALALFAGWWLVRRGWTTSLRGAPVWPPLSFTLASAALPFTGMRWSAGADRGVLAAWIACAALLAPAAWRAGALRSADARHAAALAALGLVLPGTWGDFTYVNTRLFPVASACAALALARAPLRGPTGPAVALLALTLTAQSLVLQARVSADLAQALPVLARIPPGARVLPLVFEPGSPVLEPVVFSPALHMHHYYHLRTASGRSPYAFDSSLQPVHLRDAARLPAPGEFTPERFRWDRHGHAYDAVLVCGAAPGHADAIEARASLVARQGAWALYEVHRGVTE